jgi:hypothetical protein
MCAKGVIYWELLGKQAISYRAQLEKLESEVVKQGLLSDKIIVTEKIAKFGPELLPHPPFSPVIANKTGTSNYHLFPSLSNHLMGKNFENDEFLKIEIS